MQQYLEHSAGKSPKYWKIELQGLLLKTQYGKIGSAGRTSKKVFLNHTEAFATYRSEIIKKMKDGYADPNQNCSEEDFSEQTFISYLEQRAYDEALAWLAKFGDLVDASFEDRLINTYLEDKDYAAAEKFILKNIKNSKQADVIIRQVRYLAIVNPMMCRFMIGNLPQAPSCLDEELYYQNLAIAQSGIGMLDSSETILKRVQNPKIQITYLVHLLHTPQKNTAQQVSLLNKAVEIFEAHDWESSVLISFFLLFGKMAQNIGLKEAAKELYEQAKILKEAE